MDDIQETPIKRRKLATGDVSQAKAFDSENDSGDDLLDDYDANTQPTLPKSVTQNGTYVTQPTQIIGQTQAGDDQDGKDSVVQVVGSSPVSTKPSAPPTNRGFLGSVLANSMAPPGTMFRPPNGIKKPAAAPVKPNISQIHDISSDEDELVRYRHASSDEDTQTAERANIKPSSFQSSSTNKATSSFDRFRDTLKSSVYDPGSSKNGSKTPVSAYAGSVYDSRNRDDSQTNSTLAVAPRSSDVMANAYGQAASHRPRNNVRQSGPAKAVAFRDLSLDDVPDAQMRSKVERMRALMNDASVSTCLNALIIKKGNFEDACDFMLSTVEIDLTMSDDDLAGASKKGLQSRQPQKKVSTKQQLKAPNKNIQQKWTATQNFLKETQQSPPPSPEAPKPRRRLVQGRKRAPSPPSSPVAPVQETEPTVVQELSSQESDSGFGTETEESGADQELLDFLNKCEVAELLEIPGTTYDDASELLDKRPFSTLDGVRKVTSLATSTKGKKKPFTKLIGEKIVEKCIEMWEGYDAIDKLASQCEDLGRPLREEMESWVVSSSITSNNGELELADIEVVSNGTRDSGIGTPSSRNASVDDENEAENKITGSSRSKRGLLPQPATMAPGVMLKDYQLIGINWLLMLFDRDLSGILADDMGLGKTCQVIAFLALLKERRKVNGPHVVIVPASTIENWLREFQRFCPELNVMPYYAKLNERPDLQEQVEASRDSINVLITTYTIAKAKDDNRFLRRLKPVCVVYDEGHVLRNSKAAGYEKYMRIDCRFRLLLTGTPLQNNLAELASLLGFILPAVFENSREELQIIFNQKAKTTDTGESHAALLSSQRIQRAKRMMTPFVLRRKKHQVLKYLPAKHNRIESCTLFPEQIDIYENERTKALSVATARAAGEKITNSDTSNVIMTLRKASIHPLLFRRHYTDKLLKKMSKVCLKEEQFRESNVDLVFEDMSVMTDMELHRFCERYPDTMAPFALKNDEWMRSGKVAVLAELLQKYKANGDRALVFSQFVMVLDVLEYVLDTLEMKYFRLDGTTKIAERQDMLDQFHLEPEITVFLLSTGAGGAGINLACANKVVIFDSSFNPQVDIQAENRAHRVGQTREVEVVRLVTEGTIEEQIHKLGETKVSLDNRVAGFDDGDGNGTAAKDGDESIKKAEALGEKMVTNMIMEQLQQEQKKKGEETEAEKRKAGEEKDGEKDQLAEKSAEDAPEDKKAEK